MKKVFIAVFLVIASFGMKQASAQVSLSINIGSQPAWGPTGYDYVQYYYLPDINAYYNVTTAQYIYLSHGRWRTVKRLPSIYRNYDIYNSYKVVVNRNRPYLNNAADIRSYSQYKSVHNQTIIRDATDTKYYVNKGNKYHNQYKQNRGRGRH